MKKIILFIVVVVSSIFSETVIEDRIVAVVGKEPILLSEIQMALLMQTEGNLPEDSTEYNKMLKSVLDNFVEEKLIYEAAEKESISVAEEYLDNAFNERWEALKSNFANEELLEQGLSEEGYTIPEFKKQMRKKLKEALIRQQFMKAHFNDVNVSRDYVDSFYNVFIDSLPSKPPSVSLSVIVLKNSQTEIMLSDMKMLTDSIAKSLTVSSNFDSVASKLKTKYPSYQIDAIVSDTKFAKGDLQKSIEDAAYPLNKNEISKPVNAEGTFYIIKRKNDNSNFLMIDMIVLRPPKVQNQLENYSNGIYQRLLAHPDSFDTFVSLYSIDE